MRYEEDAAAAKKETGGDAGRLDEKSRGGGTLEVILEDANEGEHIPEETNEGEHIPGETNEGEHIPEETGEGGRI